jgi:antitoxin ParD1/3/4
MKTYKQDQCVKKLNKAIDMGLKQLNTGNKISAKDSYDKLKEKINKIAKRQK